MSQNLSPATLIRTGTIMPYLGGATSTPPSGWLFCTGREISRTEYGDLFSEIGVRYGVGNGSTTFNLPGPSESFFRGGLAGVAGFSTVAGSSSHRHAFATNMSITVGSEQSHTHGANAGSTNTSNWSHKHRITGPDTGIESNRAGRDSGNLLTTAAINHSHTVQTTSVSNDHVHNHSITPSIGSPAAAHNHSVSIGNATNNDPFFTSFSSSTNPPNVLIWHIIKT